MATLDKALEICKELHKGQVRRDGETPYSSHPIAVSEMMNTDEEKIVALLHDILEDTPLTASHLKHSGFSDKVIENIVCLTKLKYESYDEYITEISFYPIATKVKIADMFHNMSCSPTKKQKEKYLRSIKFLLSSI